MNIESRRGTAGCGWRLDEDQQKRRCASTGSDRVTVAWKQISKQRRRVDVSYDPSMVTALQHGTWMDESQKASSSLSRLTEKVT